MRPCPGITVDFHNILERWGEALFLPLKISQSLHSYKYFNEPYGFYLYCMVVLLDDLPVSAPLSEGIE